MARPDRTGQEGYKVRECSRVVDSTYDSATNAAVSSRAKSSDILAMRLAKGEELSKRDESQSMHATLLPLSIHTLAADRESQPTTERLGPRAAKKAPSVVFALFIVATIRSPAPVIHVIL